MKVLIVYAHPERQSFGRALLSTSLDALSEAGHEVVVSNLYTEKFSPVAGAHDFTDRQDNEVLNLGAEQAHAAKKQLFADDIQGEIDRLFKADLLILQFPMWWYSVPAIMKGWIDRVFAYGVTYEFDKTWDRGIMRGRKAMLAFTTGAPESAFATDGRNGDLERVLWPLHAGTLGLVGYEVLPPFVGWAPAFRRPEERTAILEAYAARLANIEHDKPLFFHGLDDYDEHGRLKDSIEPATPCQHRGPRKHL